MDWYKYFHVYYTHFGEIRISTMSTSRGEDGKLKSGKARRYNYKWGEGLNRINLILQAQRGYEGKVFTIPALEGFTIRFEGKYSD